MFFTEAKIRCRQKGGRRCHLQLIHQRWTTAVPGHQVVHSRTWLAVRSAQKTTQLLPSEVGVLKFTATNVGYRVEENIGTKGSRMSLEHMYCNNLNIPTLFRVAASEVPCFCWCCTSLIFCFVEMFDIDSELQLQLLQLFFEGHYSSLSIYNYLYIN